jgi:23S rRNA (adenine2503-C2)-methyltransferase
MSKAEERIDIKSLNFTELVSKMEELGEKKFRAKQIYDWMHVRYVASIDDMTDISIKLREKLKTEYDFTSIKPIQVLTSAIDGTQKFLFELSDGNVVEGVFMKYKHGNSACISTQVGCRMGCRFCASTLDGLERDLTPGEMLEEIYCMQRETGERISNIVLMGSGEPLDNYDNVVKFLRMVSDEHGLNISIRNITLSTCGLVPKMKQLAEEGLPVTLALSLHASSDEKRKVLMPIANAYKLEDVLNACRYYFDKTGRRITFEYSLVLGVNDSVEEANALARLLAGINCHVNLIPVNPIKERDYKQTIRKDVEKFKLSLEKNRINVTIRREMGADINGACGQLRKSYKDNNCHCDDTIPKEKEGDA